MKSFKEYIKEKPIDQSKINQALGRTLAGLEHNLDPLQEDINIIKNNPQVSQIAAEHAIKCNKIIPEEFIESIKSKDSVLFYKFIYRIKLYYKEKISEILQRNPELMEYFI